MSGHKAVAKQRRNLSGVASAQARMPARRECGREFRVLGTTENKRPVAYSLYLKLGTLV